MLAVDSVRSMARATSGWNVIPESVCPSAETGSFSAFELYVSVIMRVQDAVQVSSHMNLAVTSGSKFGSSPWIGLPEKSNVLVMPTDGLGNSNKPAAAATIQDAVLERLGPRRTGLLRGVTPTQVHLEVKQLPCQSRALWVTRTTH